MKLELSANLGFLWKELPLEQRIGKARDAGFDAVEFHDDWRHCDLERLKVALGGLPLTCLNTEMGETFGLAALVDCEPEARAAIEAAIAAAAKLGVKAVHVTAGKVGRSPQSDQVYLRNLRHAVEIARPEGISILIEPIAPIAVPGYYLASLEQADAVLAQIPGMRMLFDCFHVAALGHDIETAFAARAGTIGHVQIAAIPGRAEPDSGGVNYTALLPLLVKTGYRGSFGAEYRPAAETESGLGWMKAFR